MDDTVTAVLVDVSLPLLPPTSEDTYLAEIGRAVDPDGEANIGLTKLARRFRGKKTVNPSELFKEKASVVLLIEAPTRLGTSSLPRVGPLGSPMRR